MSSYPSESIAIIGMAARFPGAQDLDEFWSNLRKSKESIVFPSDAELLAAGVPPELLADSSYVKAHAETPDIESFDAEFFGFTPRDAAILDPQIRMFMEVCHDAVEQAGYDPAKIGDGVGVFGATGVNNYLDLHIRSGSGYQMLSATGVAASALSYPDYVATHVAYRFGFRGPALTVSTACSSSAVAVHLACQALRLGECDHAIAGGSEVEMPARQGYQWDAGGPLSADGHCRPFDRLAGGTVFSSGAGAVLLKRLEDAIADGDHVWAVIRSSAVNNDGATKAGFAAPGIPGQAAAVTEAVSLAGLTARDLDFVEAHGTGTALGDPVEVAALATAFRNCGGGERPGSAGLSSVKGNIGHLGHASGIASIVKTALCLRHEERVPTVNFIEPNPRLNIDETPFRVDAATIAWPRSDRPRVAGVNSLGFGGTNAHLILAEGPVDHRTPGSGRPEVVIWSARAERAAADYRQALAEHLSEADDDAFCDIVGVLQEGRTEHPVRRAIVAGDAAEAVECLETGEILAHDADGGTGETPRPIVFAFPGQASQHPRMASGLYGREPVFTKVFDECLEGFEQAGTAAEPLRDTWLGGDETAVNSTLTAQPLLFAVEMALTAMWSSWGIEPDVVVGHSLGEITAGAVAGVFTLDEAIRLVHARARAMAALPGGAMAAVTAPPDRVADVLGGAPAIAVVNAPDQTVIAGTAEEIDAALTALSAANLRGRRIATSHAFHSPSMSPAVAEFAAAFAEVDPRPPAIPMISASTGAAVGDEARDPMFWAAQIAEPVRFDLALAALPDQHGTLVLEAGPGQVLTALVRAGLREAATVPTLPHRDGPETDLRSALSAVATVWVNGHRVDWANVRLGRPVRRVPVPGYRYQRKRHWIEPPPRPSEPGAEAGSSAPARRAGTAPGSGSGSAEVGDERPFSVLTWTADPNPGSRRAVGDRGLALVLLPADEAAGMTAVLALQRAGHRIAVVRPGARFEETDGEFRVRLDDAADIDRVFRRLADRGQSVSTLVHALALTDWPRPTTDNIDELLTLGHHSLSLLIQRGARHITAPEVLVLADSSADITGAEPAHPVKAALHGAVRSLAQEAPEMRCRLLDLAAVTAEGLAAELAAAGGPTVIALRGPRRWIRTERPYLPSEPDRRAIRHRGVYLVTGGFGGLGTEVARSIAATGMAPRLILVGRSLPPERRLAELTRCIERLGGTVQAEACDVGDQRAMRRIFDTARARHGAVHGVLHLAGVPGDTMLLRRERQDAAAVLWPKVRGALVLEKVLQTQPPLDFLVMFSSRAAVSGLVGGADYAAANCFLDAQAGVLAGAGVPVLSIDWPAWRETGMAARPGGGQVWRTSLDAADVPVLDEHRVDGKPVMPGTGHLDLIARAFRETVATAGAPLRFSDVVFRQVLVAERPREIAIAFSPDGDDWAFEVSSAPGDGAGEPVVHAAGSVSVLGRPALRTAEELPDLRARLRRRVTEPDGGDGGDADRIFTLGPRWDNIVQILAGSDDHSEKLVEIALPEPFAGETGSHILHPTILDSATSELRTEGHDAVHLPFGYEIFEVHRDLPPRLFSHIRRRPAGDGLIRADIRLFAEDGRLVAAIDGFTMRKVDGNGFLAPAKAAGGSATTAVEGIGSAEGARLFMALLGGRHPHQVAVRPYAGDRPVPLPEAIAEPGAAVPEPLPVQAPVVQAPVASVGTAATGSAQPVPAAAETPAGAVLDRLGAVWKRLLGSEVTPDSNFLDLGGNSLTAVELMAAVRTEFGVRAGMVTLFDHPTLGEFADAIVAQGAR